MTTPYKARSMGSPDFKNVLKKSADTSGGHMYQAPNMRSVPLPKSSTYTPAAPIYGGKKPA